MAITIRGRPDEETDKADLYRGTRMYLRVILVVAVAAGVLILAVQNTQTVTMEWLFLAVTGPLFAFVIGAALMGILTDELIGLAWRSRERTRRALRAEEPGAAEATIPEPGLGRPPAADAGESPGERRHASAA